MKDEYAFEAGLYDKVWGKHDYDLDVKFLNKLFRKNGCRRILDVGCGTGNHSIRLGELRYNVLGVDASPAMLKIARRKVKNKRVSFKLLDMKNLGSAVPEKTFDGAIMLGHVAYHLNSARELKVFLRQMRKVLKKKGLFVFNARNVKQINEQLLNNLRLGHIVNDDETQAMVMEYNTRDAKDPSTIIWRPLFLFKEAGKVDFQIREHRLQWFEFSTLKKRLVKNGFRVLATYSGPSGKKFDENADADMWFVTQAE